MEFEEPKKEIRVCNSDGMCLLENWVEERAVHDIDSEGFLKTGHKGILSVDFDAKPENLTTVRVCYKKPEHPGIRTEGKRKQMMMRMLYAEIAKDVDKTFHPDPEPLDYKSETMDHFGGRFHGNPLLGDDETIVPDTVYNEQPATFWTENQNKITGVSQVKVGDTPFRKNNSFSRPIGEYWDQTQPYDIENYPKM